MQFSSQFLQYFRHPKQVGAFNTPFFAQVGHEENGDVLQLYLQVEKNIIINACFKAKGSPVLMASAEYLCQFILQKTLEEIKNIEKDAIMQALGLNSLHMSALVLVLTALQEACHGKNTTLV